MGGDRPRRPAPVAPVLSGADQPDAAHPRPGQGGVFGRRAGRRLRDRPSALMQNVLPALAIGADDVLGRHALFPDTSAMRLEIGFGGGEHLAHEAAAHPATGFIGCEPFRNGIAKFVELAEARALRNVRVWTGDAGLLIDRLPAASLAGVDLFYPDPWPKRRQRKRRFVSDAILVRLARAMRPGSRLRFATDIDDYAGWTLARVLRSAAFVWEARNAEDWRRPWAGWPSTRYEAKSLREGRQPVYLTFIRTGGETPPAPG